MKTKQLLLTLLALASFSFVEAGTIYICGAFSNVNGPVTVHMEFNDNGTMVYDSAVSGPNGDFCDSITVSSSAGFADMWYINCHGDTIRGRNFFQVGHKTRTITPIDYCPRVGSPTCKASYTVYQAYNNVTRTAIPFVLQVVNTSMGTGLTYSWNFGDGTTGTGANLTHTYSTNGAYNLCLMIDNGRGCRDTFCDSIAIDTNGMKLKKSGFSIQIGNATVGVDELKAGVSVVIYPNPTTDYTVLEFNSEVSTDITISVLDVSGRKVTPDRTTSLNQGTQEVKLNLQDLPAGVYYVKVSSDRGNITKKLLIE